MVTLYLCGSRDLSGPTTRKRQRLPAITPPAFGLFPVRSPLLRESLLLSLPGGTKMFQFPPCRLLVLWIQTRIPEVCSGGFPHWEIPGSQPAYGSPRLIAVNHVLLRLLVPRHPPYTLFNLTVSLYNGRSFFLLPFYLIIKEHKQSLVQDKKPVSSSSSDSILDTHDSILS
uniref:Uncharacterized protein n=1 Tax=uncultured Atribacterota bacterium TaxID=263865 RepID=G3BMG2_9BACT|nr:hypothetical protein [uncultured Atribacterota bacterium]